MAQAAKSVASRAAQIASTPVSTLRHFPPKEAILNPTVTHTQFSPEIWANLQPAPDTALTALAHRIGLAKVLTNVDDIRQACTHKSFPPFFAAHNQADRLPACNDNLAALGNSLLGLFATEYLHASYVHLPTRVLKAAVSAYVGPTTCATVAREMGITPLLKWNNAPSIAALSETTTLAGALATVPRSLTALVYRRRSLPLARRFVQAFFLSREVDLRPLLKFRDPKMTLSRTVSKFQRERPVSRLLKETGRKSNSPIFVVGIYSGQDKLGEGFGSSLKMAEFRAAEDSLHRLYLTRTPADLIRLPTSGFSNNRDSLFDFDAQDDDYVSGELGEVEVVYASQTRTQL